MDLTTASCETEIGKEKNVSTLKSVKSAGWGIIKEGLPLTESLITSRTLRKSSGERC